MNAKTTAVAPVAAATAVAAAVPTKTVAGKVRVAPELAEVRVDVAMPQKRRGGMASHYDFDSLTAVGASFGIKNKSASQISSIVSKENRRYMSETVDPTNPAKKVKTFAKKFDVFDVDAKNDPDGAKCRVFRTI